MNRAWAFGILLLAVALVASGSCLLTGQYLKHRQAAPEFSHAWIHHQLAITPDQDRKLGPIEAAFTEKRRHYAELIRLANLELAQAVADDQADSPRVQVAVEKIHDAMGGLQNATLDHVFEMKAVLTPEQYDKLIRLTSEGLRRQP
ncbi:MAG: periplasmic heavy metal sensor [Verrucomicrobium sp.]|nr:periplasmic heavy metal sensor [Verrucomicrobium sp.]